MARRHDDAHRPLQGVRRRAPRAALPVMRFSDGAQLVTRSAEELAAENDARIEAMAAQCAAVKHENMRGAEVQVDDDAAQVGHREEPRP